MSRVITHRYRDPLDEIWIGVARRMGLTIERSSECFASLQGDRLIIGAPETLDADDCLAQMIFHELCHSLVQGHEGLSEPDWGLLNIDPTEADDTREHAALRVQAKLAGDYGLRRIFATTTDFRAYYDALPADPMQAPAGDPSLALAEAALARVDVAPWGPHLRDGLRASQNVISASRPFAGDDALIGLSDD